MKNKASSFLKQIMSLLSSIAKAKSLAIKNKTSTFRARILMLSLMKDKKFLIGSISNKINNLLSHRKNSEEDDEDHENNNDDKAIVLYNAKSNNCPASSSTQYLEEDMDDDVTRSSYCYYDEDDDGKYPDLRHSLFNDEFDDPGGSIIELVKNSKEGGADFSLEDEIDNIADLFIGRIHKQMRLQKLDSFKRYKEMLERSA